MIRVVFDLSSPFIGEKVIVEFDSEFSSYFCFYSNNHIGTFIHVPYKSLSACIAAAEKIIQEVHSCENNPNNGKV